MRPIASATHPGPRESLEDAIQTIEVHALPAALGAITILGIGDGVGGEAGGEIASNITTSYVGRTMMAAVFELQLRCLSDEQAVSHLKDRLEVALHEANQLVRKYAEEDQTLAGMATTAVFVIVLQHHLIVGWAGDSRAYLFSKGRLLPLTRDHSVVAELVESGVITAEQAKDHPRAHVITRCIGQRKVFAPELSVHPLPASATVLLCTDGLTDVVPFGQLQRCLAQVEAGELAFDDLPRTLIQRAICAGTGDNVSVVCCRTHALRHDLALSRKTATGDYAAVVAQNLSHLQLENQS